MSRIAAHLLLLALPWFACGNGQRHNVDPGSPAMPSAPPPIPSASASVVAPTISSADADVPAAASSNTSDAGVTSGPWSPSPTLGNFERVAGKVEPVPPLRDASGKPLPQTDVLPSLESPSFNRRMELLFEAIVKGDPDLATPAFFPVLAYEQVKAISQPARDHKSRLMAAFAKNIRDYHKRLGKRAAESKLLAVLPSTLRPRWMKPGTEGNKLGYHRVLQTRLKIADGSGTEHLFEITSMISWRGEWYVVHLNGFK